MPHPEILLTVTGVIGLVFLLVFAGVIPICISAKATKDEEYDDEEAWMNALVGMWCFMCVDILVFIWSDGIFEANGVAPGGGVVVGRGIWLVLALISTLIAVYCSVAIRKRAYRR